MKICKICGKELEDNAIACVGCGCSCNASNREATTGEIAISAIFPIVGGILYYIYKNDSPIAAKTLNKVSIYSFLVYIALGFMVGFIRGFLSAL